MTYLHLYMLQHIAFQSYTFTLHVRFLLHSDPTNNLVKQGVWPMTTLK
jgi:hypothetical protein